MASSTLAGEVVARLGTIILGARSFPVHAPVLTLEWLWESRPGWTLEASIELPSGELVPLSLGGHLQPGSPKPSEPTQLAGAHWDVDAGHRDGDVFGTDGKLELDGERVSLLLLGNSYGDPPLHMRATPGPDEVSLRIWIEGMCELGTSEAWELDTTKRESFTVLVDARVARMSPSIHSRGAIWPPGPHAEVIACLSSYRDVYLQPPLPESVCHGYFTCNEGSGGGYVVLAPSSAAAGESLLMSGMRLLRVYMDCSYKRDVENAWNQILEPLLVEGAFTDGVPEDTITVLDAEAVHERLDWIQGVLTLAPPHSRPNSPPNPQLTITIDRAQTLRGADAMSFPWPVREAAQLGVSLRDRWNHKILLARTSTQDVLVVWGTGA